MDVARNQNFYDLNNGRRYPLDDTASGTDDAGQILAKTASKSDANYAFKVTTQNGDKYYFQAKVMSFKVGVGGVDTVTSATMTLEITTSSTGVGIVETLAS